MEQEEFARLLASAHAGDLKAMVRVGFAYMCGDGVQLAPDEGIRWTQRAAELGDSNAMTNLGLAFWLGSGVPRDDNKAFYWTQMAAAAGNAMAQANLASLYKDGVGVAKNIDKFVDLSQRAAAHGNVIAIANLGVAYKDGIGVQKDTRKFFELSSQAALGGNAIAMHNLGLAYRDGVGTDRDLGKAFDWFQRGAQLGDTDCMHALALAYRHGTGTTENASQFFAWTRKASQSGHPEAMHNLSIAYRDGIGTEPDISKYVEWHSRAARAGFKPEATDAKQIQLLTFSYDEYDAVLPKRPAQMLGLLRKAMDDAHSTFDESQRWKLLELRALLERLDSFLLQVSRMAVHADETKFAIRSPEGPVTSLLDLMPSSSMFFVGKEACTDFESLLFQGSALLDRMTLTVGRLAEGKHGTPPRYLKALRRFLEGCSGDKRAAEVLRLLDLATSTNGIFFKLESQEHTLRSMLLHRKCITEDTAVLFVASRLDDGRFILFDCESLGYPVISTARAIATDLPFLLMNTLAAYLELEERLERSAFEPTWGRLFVVFTESIDPSGQGPKVSVGVRMIPGGTRIRVESIKEDVVKRAFVVQRDMQGRRFGFPSTPIRPVLPEQEVD